MAWAMAKNREKICVVNCFFGLTESRWSYPATKGRLSPATDRVVAFPIGEAVAATGLGVGSHWPGP
jgi:hypothetical protein